LKAASVLKATTTIPPVGPTDAEQLRAAIAALPTPFRETLVLRDIDGLDYREIAKVTDVPIGTVMSRLARGRYRLLSAIVKSDALGVTA
jgi:RNA polymerase sigma-70 factor (ECF subfamily)